MTLEPVGPRRRRIIVLVAALVVGFLGWVAPRAWQRMCGNHRIAFYGRVVDQQGRPMPGVRVEIQILQSPGIGLPVMYGRGERVKAFVLQTSTDGRFEFGDMWGYSVSIRGLSTATSDLVFAGAPPYPRSNWSLDRAEDRGSLPSTKDQPITYRMRPKSFGR